MSEQQWRVVWQLYQAVAELSLQEARVVIHSATSDSEIIAEILSMLEDGSGRLDGSAPATGARRSGERIGCYVVLAKMGQGSLGEAWSGQDSTTGQTVFLRFLTGHLIDSRSISVDHPNVAAVLALIDGGHETVVATEWVDGVNLKTLSHTKIPVDQTIHIARQAAGALAAAHAAGIIHGNLRPGNLMLRPDGIVKVLDLGLSGRGLSAADDVFALGLVMYELLTGSPPTDTALRNRNFPRPSAFNPSVPPQVDRLIESMLSPEPERRPSAAQIARTRLTPEPGSGASKESTKDQPRQRTWQGLSFVAVLLVAIGVLTSLGKRSSVPAEPVMRALTDNASEERITAAAISPDGKWLGYASLGGIFLRLVENGDTRPLSPPPNLQVDRLVWFPDGLRLLVGGFSITSNRPSLWTVPISGDPPSLLRQESQAASASPDGSQIAFTSSDGAEIWTAGSNGESARRVIAASPADTFPIVLWSPNGKRLSYQRRHYAPRPGPHEDSPTEEELDYQRSYESIDLASGEVVAKEPNLWMSAAVALSDGQIVFARRESSERYMQHNLWKVRTNPKTGAFETAPRRITSHIGERIIALSAPAHGGGLVLVVQSSQADVYVGELHQPGPTLVNVRRLTLDQRDDFPHSWTADSTAVIFESNRNGNWDLFKQSVGDRSAKVLQASSLIEYMARLMPDGQSILYFAYQPSEGPLRQELFRLGFQGGPPEKVRAVGAISDFRCSGPAGKRCVMRSVEQERQVFYELDPILGRGRELLRAEWSPGLRQDWDISSDGREISIERWDPEEARIRRTRLEDNAPPERLPDVIVSGWSRIGDINYAADGKGWFASAEAPVGATLLYVDSQGAARVLQRLDYGSWGVPSPDGRRLAFTDRIMLANAWMIDRF